MIPVVFAEGQPPPPDVPFYLNPLFLITMMILFWVVIILPASRRQRREQEQMLSSLKRGAKVVTTAGIVGTVVQADEGSDQIVVRSEDTRIRVLRSAVAKVYGTEDDAAAK